MCKEIIYFARADTDGAIRRRRILQQHAGIKMVQIAGGRVRCPWITRTTAWPLSQTYVEPNAERSNRAVGHCREIPERSTAIKEYSSDGKCGRHATQTANDPVSIVGIAAQ